MLIKANPSEFKDPSIIYPLLRSYKKPVILDYYLRPRIDEIIPINFLGKVMFVNKNSFIQSNKILSKIIRKNVLNNISKKHINTLTCIGGESYMYSFFVNFKTTFFTNNSLILNDAELNKQFYKPTLDNKLVDYNKDKFLVSTDYLIINLSKLNLNLIKQINNIKIKKIIIISCHHKDFWKKIKYLTNYKLYKRTNYVDEKLGYFISINILS